MADVRRSRGVGENRFYSPPALRRQQKVPPQHQQQKVQQHQKIEAVASPEPVVEPEPEPESLTNLDRFLEHTTPRVPVQFLSKTSMREWRTSDHVEPHPYFVLGDLWETFKEWSAYGAGVPLVLSGNEAVIQYYVPYLSAIQLYVDPSKTVTEQRTADDESDLDSSRDDSSDDNEDDNGADNIEEPVRLQDRALAERMFLTDYSFAEFPREGEEKEIKNPPGLLVFEHFAHDPPYGRQPLVDKISQLASQFPDLRTYKSCELTTASWVSVAWYPIYRIPMGPTLQSLDACFLTYHSLSTPLTRATSLDSSQFHGTTMVGSRGETDMPQKFALSTFALASYKFRISFWTHIGDNDESQKSESLTERADNWLRLLQVEHPDFNFFQSHSSYWL